MTSLDAVHSAQVDVAKLQTTLSEVQTGLGHVESAVVTAKQARRGLRRVVRIGLLIVVIMVIVKVATAKSRKPDDADT